MSIGIDCPVCGEWIPFKGKTCPHCHADKSAGFFGGAPLGMLISSLRCLAP